MNDGAPQSAEVTGAGLLLRHAREAAGLHLPALAAALKVPVGKLEALEADRYDLLPDLTFARALALSVCRTLKIDPQPVLERLPHTVRPRLVTDDQGINAPFRPAGEGPSPGLLQQLSRPVVLAVLALLLAALVLVFLPGARRDGAVPAEATAATGEQAPTSSGQVVTTVVTPAVELAPAQAAAPAPAPAVGPPAPLAMPPASAAAPVAAATITAPAPVVAAPSTATPSTPATGVVRLRARNGESWVQVTDATGAVVLQRTLQPGEAAGADGRAPFSVVIGNAAATDVEVRGKPYSFTAHRDNVARFQID